MDVGILTTALNELTRSVVTGFGILGDDALAILRWAMMLSYTLALILWLWDGRPAVHGPFFRMLLKFAAIGWLLEWFPQGSARLMQAAADTGVRVMPVEGFSLADPGQIAFLGIQAITPLMIRVKQMLGPIDFFLNFLEIVLFLLAMLITVVSFCILAIQVFLAFLEFRLLSLAAYLAIPFAVLGPTSFVAERSIGYIAASALKLLVRGAIVAVCGATLLSLTFQGDPTLAQAFGIAVLAAAIFVLAIKAPRAAAGLVNGGPVMDGVTALAGLWAAGQVGLRTATTVSSITSGGAGMALTGIQAALGGMRSLAGTGGSGMGGAATASAGMAGRRYPGGTVGGRAGPPTTGNPGTGGGPAAAAGWERPMTEAQRAELDRLAGGRAYDQSLSRGQASRLIQGWGGETSWYEGSGSTNAPGMDRSSNADRARREPSG